MDLRQTGSIDSSLRLTSTALNRAWTVGQILQATVVSQTGADTFLLRAGTSTFEARSTLTLSAGQALQLQVAPGSNSGQTIMRVLPPPALEESALAQALRHALPRQIDIAPVLQRLLTDLAGPSTEGGPNGGLRTLLARIQASLPDTRTVTQPETLSRAVSNSGTLLEARLAHGSAPDPQLLAHDLKANFLRLAAHLKGGMPSPLITNHSTSAAPTIQDPSALSTTARDIAQQVDGALARIQINQLNSLPREDGTPPALVVEVPLRHGDQLHSLRLRIERDKDARASDPDSLPWSVSIELDPPGLGPVRARVTALARDVSVAFWTEQAQTAILLRNNLATLQDNFHRDGLRCRELACHVGSGPDVATGVRGPAGLLDEHA
jgi:flagellar hook-length control protein FliK